MLNEASAPPAVPPDVQELLNSKAFQRASTLRALLLYLWERQDQTPTEYDIAIDALGKSSDFDPKLDATVRVHMARLRQKLREYYENEGARCTARLEIPAGAYRIEVQHCSAVQEPAPVAQTPRRMHRGFRFAAFGVCVLLAVAATAIWLENRSLRARLATAPAAPAPVPWFWKPFMGNGRGIQLIYPSPVFLEWPKHRLRVRDVGIDDFSQVQESRRIRRLASLFGGPPRLNQRYTVNTDAIAAVKLSKFLARYGVDLKVFSTSNYAQEANTTDHVILLGIPATNPKLSSYIPATGFQFSDRYSGIHPSGPHPDPRLTLKIRRQSERRVTEPGLLAMLPGQNPQTQVLILAGSNSSALASLLVTPSTLDELHDMWAAQGEPPHFSALIDAESDGETTLRTRILHLQRAGASL